MLRERLEKTGINCWVFDRRIGPDKRLRVTPLRRVFGGISNKIAVLITIALVQRTAIGACSINSIRISDA